MSITLPLADFFLHWDGKDRGARPSCSEPWKRSNDFDFNIALNLVIWNPSPGPCFFHMLPFPYFHYKIVQAHVSSDFLAPALNVSIFSKGDESLLITHIYVETVHIPHEFMLIFPDSSNSPLGAFERPLHNDKSLLISLSFSLFVCFWLISFPLESVFSPPGHTIETWQRPSKICITASVKPKKRNRSRLTLIMSKLPVKEQMARPGACSVAWRRGDVVNPTVDGLARGLQPQEEEWAVPKGGAVRRVDRHHPRCWELQAHQQVWRENAERDSQSLLLSSESNTAIIHRFQSKGNKPNEVYESRQQSEKKETQPKDSGRT